MQGPRQAAVGQASPAGRQPWAPALGGPQACLAGAQAGREARVILRPWKQISTATRAPPASSLTPFPGRVVPPPPHSSCLLTLGPSRPPAPGFGTCCPLGLERPMPRPGLPTLYLHSRPSFRAGHHLPHHTLVCPISSPPHLQVQVLEAW